MGNLVENLRQVQENNIHIDTFINTIRDFVQKC